MHEASLSRQFGSRRRGVRACFLVGVVLVAVSRVLAEWWLAGIPRGIAFVAGLALLGATFPLYRRYANRCPRCSHSFSEVREYAGSETVGLPLFNTIDGCPACGLSLRSRGPS